MAEVEPPPETGDTPYDRLPVQLRPLIAVTGGSLTADAVAATLTADPLLASTLVAPAGLPPAPDHDELYRGLDEADAARLRALADRLVTVLDIAYPPVPGQLASSVSCHLHGASGEVREGTVSYVRTTAGGTVQYLLPHVVLDPQTLSPLLVGLAEPSPPPRLRRSSVREVPQGVTTLMAVGGTLAWGLPPPWNVVTAATVTLFEQLLNSSSARSPLADAVSELEQFVNQATVGRWASQIRGFALFVNAQRAGLDVNTDHDAYIREVLTPELRRITSPTGDSLYDAIHALEDLMATGDPPFRKTVLDLLLSGVTLYLLALKMIVQLDATLAAAAEDAGDDGEAIVCTARWLHDYVTFEQAVLGPPNTPEDGWAVRAGAAIDTYIKARSDQVRRPYRWAPRPVSYDTVPGMSNPGGWTYHDDALPGDKPDDHFVADSLPTTCCDPGAQHGDKVDAAFNQHLAEIARDINRRRPAVDLWRSAIADWRRHLPPPPPAVPPQVATLPGGPATPRGALWQRGASVQYAVGFLNEAGVSTSTEGLGPSGAGPESRWLPIEATAGVRVSAIPADPSRLATRVRLYRRFRSAGAPSPWQVVAALPAGTTTYDDTDGANG